MSAWLNYNFDDCLQGDELVCFEVTKVENFNNLEVRVKVKKIGS